MVKAKTKALNLLLPETLSDWFSEYAKSENKTKTEIICTLLQGLQNGEAYSDVVNPVDNPVDDIEAIIKTYLDNHLQDCVDSILHSSKQADVVNPVESAVDDSVDNHVDDSVDTDVESVVVNPVDDSEPLPTIEAIATPAKPKTTKRSAKAKEGMNTSEAYDLACSRGFTTQSKDAKKAFRESFDGSNVRADLGLKRIPHKQGRENWLYFDTSI
jgi:hypothetical protein